jgi:hypothetical protein
MNMTSLRAAAALAIAALALGGAAPALAFSDGTSNTLQSAKLAHSFQGGCSKYSDDAC